MQTKTVSDPTKEIKMLATRNVSFLAGGLAPLCWLFICSCGLSADRENQPNDSSFADFAQLRFVPRGDVPAAIGRGDCPTGFTSLMLDSDEEKTTRVLVSCAFGRDDRTSELRLVARTKDGKIIHARAFAVSGSTGRKYRVVTIVSEFPTAHDNIDGLIVQRKKKDD